MPGVEQTGPFDQISREQYDSTFDTNVWGVLNSMKQNIAAMLRNGGGAIVNNSSVDAFAVEVNSSYNKSLYQSTYKSMRIRHWPNGAVNCYITKPILIRN
jgi:NADP-dependent 3-hydroxy acid dehydrogenase YdfG